MPYTYCFKLNKVCKIAKESSRYINRYILEQQKIKEEEQKAKEEIEIL
ncbi:hypothetical protein CI238_12026 [Colletotrichum incanum]|uniref:Uncharacterized protein n=1 Tax=Colletotrichum incanum TaxID=1573173 RepID=A0A166UJR7_COLIC|nr:hypothetical protein CI238_12026 [Colletotrichum incanum]